MNWTIAGNYLPGDHILGLVTTINNCQTGRDAAFERKDERITGLQGKKSETRGKMWDSTTIRRLYRAGKRRLNIDQLERVP